MSDFLTELRGDLVDAHARYGQRGRAGRVARPLHPRTWRPAPILAAVIAAACVIAGVAGIRAIHGPTPTSMRVVTHIDLNGDMSDATLGFGHLWTASPHTGVAQVDAANGRVGRSINTDLPIESLSAGAGAIWGNAGDVVVRIDPRTSRFTTARVPGASGVLAAGDGVVWRLTTTDPRSRLQRLDPATGRVVATVATQAPGDAIAIGGDSLWTLDARGVLTQRDPQTGQALRRVPGLGSSTGAGEKALTADATGVWAVRPGALVRVASGGSVVRRVPLPANVLTVLAEDSRALWLASGANGLKPQLLRFDRGTGKLTGTLDLGSHQPQALVPSPRGLWVVSAGGTALLVR